MTTFAFTATVTGFDFQDTDLLDKVYTDAFALVPSSLDDVVTLEVEIDAGSSESALKILVEHVATVPGVSIQRVDEDLVNIPEIAVRLDVNRETVRTWVCGSRGSGGFPPHRSVLAGGQKLWAWVTVHQWAEANDRLPGGTPAPLASTCVDWFNASRVPAAARVGDWGTLQYEATVGIASVVHVGQAPLSQRDIFILAA